MKHIEIKIFFIILIIMTLWFSLTMIELENKQHKIDELKIQVEQNHREYEEMQNTIKELLEGEI